MSDPAHTSATSEPIAEGSEEIRKALAALEPFLAALNESTLVTSVERSDLSLLARSAIRFIERQLISSLNEEPLRGMSNLLLSDHPIYGVHVRKTNKSAKIWQEPGTARDYLLLIPSGELVTMRITREPGRSDAPPRYDVDEYVTDDSELRAEDLPLFIATVVHAVGNHLRVSRGTMERNKRLRRLADEVLQLERSYVSSE